MLFGSALVVLISVLAAPVAAQVQSNNLVGVVTDGQGGVLPGVTVTAISPALIGSRMQVQSGWPYARLIPVALPNAGTQTFFAEDIKHNRSDTVRLVGVRVDKALKFGDRSIAAMFDVFNLLNSNAVTNFTLINGVNYNKILAAPQPRTYQVGARLEF